MGCNSTSKIRIDSIADSYLCTGCGTCYGICPADAIKYELNERKGRNVFNVIKSECVQCGQCYSVCPGKGLNIDDQNHLLFGKLPKNPFLGNYIQCYTGFASNNLLRYKATSGGTTTALLNCALSCHLADGVISTHFPESNPTETEPFIAYDTVSLKRSIGSKYCPSSVNTILKTILKEKKRYIIVGLPCHIHGIRLAQQANQQVNKLDLVLISLFCGMNFDYRHIRWLFRYFGVDREDVVDLSYRTNGYPGNMVIDRQIGDKFTCSIEEYSIESMKALRCTVCPDTFGEFADISIGDVWLPEFSKEDHGQNMIIARTPKGQNLLLEASKNGHIHLTPSTPEKALQTNESVAKFKKNLYGRISFLRLITGTSPCYTQSQLPSSRIFALPEVKFYLKRIIKHTLFSILPPRLIKAFRR